jgi:hypothetical protein
MDTLLVEYVGLKPQETDCVAGTKITWVGLGDIKPVPASAWVIMSKHPDVWKLADVQATAAPGLANAKAAAPAPTPTPTPAPVPAPAPTAPISDVLYGSSTLPSMIEIGDQQVQLGTVVAAAHTASGLSVADWNALPAEDRDVRLAVQVEAMRKDVNKTEVNKEQAEMTADSRRLMELVLPDLDAMNDEQMRDWIAKHLKPRGIKIHSQIKGDKLRQAIAAAVKAAPKE